MMVHPWGWDHDSEIMQSANADAVHHAHAVMLHHNCNSAPQSITVQNSDAEGVICCLPTNLSHVIFFQHTSMGPLSLSASTSAETLDLKATIAMCDAISLHQS